MSNTIHYIGKVIASHRISCSRSDAHSLGLDKDRLLDMINSSENLGLQKFYYLPQQKLFEILFEKYGVEAEKKNVTTDDKIRIAGIIFCHSELREYLPDMLGQTRGSQYRADIDVASSRKLAGFRALFTKFIDHEVVIALPDKWMSENTKRSINELTREGHFEQYGSFDPNNACRIALNWTQKEVNGIFAKVVLEYQECMKRYTMGTGGGPGAPENFLTWETCDESYVSLYTQQASGLYLMVVHIWDENHGFPLVPRRDPMPDHCMINILLVVQTRIVVPPNYSKHHCRDRRAINCNQDL